MIYRKYNLILLLTGCSKQEYSKNLFYMDTIINVKLYNISESEANETFKEIENIYKKYVQLMNKGV